MPALKFKTCRLLSGNVRNKELTIVQRRILGKLRMKKRSIKKKIYPRKNRNSYIQLQTTRKLSLFHGNLPITKMHRRTNKKRRSKKETQILFLDILSRYIVPALITVFSDYLLGVPLICFSDDTMEGEANASSELGETFDLDVLAESESAPNTGHQAATPQSSGSRGASSPSVNRPEVFEPRANPVAEEAEPSRVAIPFPYTDDEVIGGDSVKAVYYRLVEVAQSKKMERRSSSNYPPNDHQAEDLFDYQTLRYQAEDLFEVKVSIIRQMAPLDPEGDWERRGARALDNSRTATGEEALEKLHAMDAELKNLGVQSPTFHLLKQKVFRRQNEDTHSET